MHAKRVGFTDSDAVLRALAEGTTDVLFVRGLDGTYLMANRAAAEANGLTLDQLIGHDDSRIFPPEVVRSMRADDQRVIDTGETLTFTRELPVRGEPRTYHTTKGPCRDAAGRIFGVFVVSRDITEHVRAAAERIALLEREKAAREKAEAAAKALETLGKVTEAALSSLQVDAVLEALVTQIRDAFAVDTVAVVLVDEQRRELSLRAASGLDEELASGLRFPDQHGVAGRIFTERRPVIFGEEELATLRHVSPFVRDHVRAALGVPLRLHDKVLGVLHLGSVAPRRFTPEEGALLQLAADRIALALEHARLFEESVRANRARDELLGVVAHDLRSPLNGIVLSANVLLRHARRCADCDPAAAAGILGSADRMNRLIQDLLDVTRLESGELPLAQQAVDVGPMLAEAVELARPLAVAKGLTLEWDADHAVPVIADRHRVLQVLANLIGNAIKFTAAGSVRVRAARTGRELRFEVADTGSGMAPEHLPHVFDRFWRLDKSDRRGVGLGLSIARGIVLAHGGQIGVESRPGEGSTFHFTLPLGERA